MKIESLTPLRFVAAMMVIIFHFGSDTWLGHVFHSFFRSGPQIVTFFFVLSGFVMVLAHINKKNESPAAFYVARLARVAPIYWITLFIALYHHYGPIGKISKLLIFLHFTFLQAWLPTFALSVNSPAWSLSAEMFFYSLFPFLFAPLQKKIISGPVFLGISVLIWVSTQVVATFLLNSRWYVPEGNLQYFLCYSPLFHLCSFLLGIAGGIIFVRHPRSSKPWNGAFSYLIVLLSGLSVYLAIVNEGNISRYFHLTLSGVISLYSPLFLLVILSIACSQNALTRLLSVPFLVLLGEVSYSMYITQYPVNWLYSGAVKYFRPQEPTYSFYMYVVLLVSISILLHFSIERPARRLIREHLSFSARSEHML